MTPSPTADPRVTLPTFEGPLDLLLFLIRKNELNIYDIPVESVTRQYIDTLHAMEELDLDVAGEFFVMAATLMEIKSRLLLPRERRGPDPAAGEEEPDPRWELVRQLLEYRKFKDAAARLGEMARRRGDLLERLSPASADAGERPLQSVNHFELWGVFNLVLRRLADKLVVGEIHDEAVTVADQMELLLARARAEKEFLFSSLFSGPVSVRRLVAAFLALLELTRLQRLRVRQDAAFADIVCGAAEKIPLETAPTPGSLPE